MIDPVQTVSEWDDLAAKTFPAEWARVVNQTGEQARKTRHNLRRAAKRELIMAPLREAGASCATCDAFRRYPHGPGMVCDDESTGGTYTMADAEGLCINWRALGKPFPGF